MKVCSVDGCIGKSRTLGLCNKHAMRLKRLGHLGDTQKAQASIGVRLLRHFIAGNPNDCWLWNGTKSKLGYGLISVGRKGEGQMLAHRVSWEVHNNSVIPIGLAVMHSCDTPLCVNPHHLKVGTQAENMLDMRTKNRGSTPPLHMGMDHRCCSFTEQQVREIRASDTGSRELAKLYDVNRTSIQKIRSRKTWKHVE